MYYFNRDMTIWKNFSYIIKKNNSELICHKKYLKAEKRFNTKDSIQCFYVPVILFDSVYRKNGNYYSNVLLETFIHNIFWKNIRNFGF